MPIRSFNGLTPTIDTTAYIDELALVLGDVHIGPDASVWPMCTIRGDVNLIRIGECTNIQDACVLHTTHKHKALPEGHALHIGARVTVGHGVLLHGCTLADGVLVGMGSVVLDGACLESGVLLGAGSLVPEGKVLEGGFLWLGRPARKVRELTPEERESIDYSAQHYVKLKRLHQV